MIVVDASVFAVAVGDDGEAGAVARASIAGHDVSAPDLLDVETASVLRARWRAGGLSAKRFAEAIEDMSSFPADRYPALPFLRRLYELRGNVSPCDATYVALAEYLGCELLTADAKLVAAPGARCSFRLVAVSGPR